MSDNNKSPFEICPMCNGDMKSDDPFIHSTMDGNYLYQCLNNKDHRFWSNPRGKWNVLHLNKSANEDTSCSEQDFYFDEILWKWIIIDN